MADTQREQQEKSAAKVLALWTAAFLEELMNCGVSAAVVSPGSRSTPLAMAAFELNQRYPQRFRLFIDIDERSAAFFGLGLAKASGHPVALICTSGTAAANYYPAVVEARTSRVPLVVLTSDRPPRLQGLGAPQTTDQLKLYGQQVRAFRAMPLPGATSKDLAFVRQAAREACLQATAAHPSYAPGETRRIAGGGKGVIEGQAETLQKEGVGISSAEEILVASSACESLAGPVHLNFPFDEPLKPDFSSSDIWSELADCNFAPQASLPAASALSMPAVKTHAVVDKAQLDALRQIMARGITLVLAGEGSCSTLAEAQELSQWAYALRLPLLADPLSGLRSLASPAVIDAYDNVFAQTGDLLPQVVIRFGRYPISKRTTQALEQARPINIVVDAGETRDFNAATDVFVPLSPLDFIRSFSDGLGVPAPVAPVETEAADTTDMADAAIGAKASAKTDDLKSCAVSIPQTNLASAAQSASFKTAHHAEQEKFFASWQEHSAIQRRRIEKALRQSASQKEFFEGAIVHKTLALTPAKSCVFVANSMAVRALDTVYAHSAKPLCLLANRGQNGIDGTLSSALGAAQCFSQTVFITGDLSLLHDVGALALQNEMLQYQPQAPSVLLVLLNNQGGAIFDMLPQASDEPYFPRLFLTPHQVDFGKAAAAFGVPYTKVESLEHFEASCQKQLGVPGISLLEIEVPLRGVKQRYEACW